MQNQKFMYTTKSPYKNSSEKPWNRTASHGELQHRWLEEQGLLVWRSGDKKERHTDNKRAVLYSFLRVRDVYLSCCLYLFLYFDADAGLLFIYYSSPLTLPKLGQKKSDCSEFIKICIFKISVLIWCLFMTARFGSMMKYLKLKNQAHNSTRMTQGLPRHRLLNVSINTDMKIWVIYVI